MQCGIIIKKNHKKKPQQKTEYPFVIDLIEIACSLPLTTNDKFQAEWQTMQEQLYFFTI